MPDDVTDLAAEDRKLLTLARSTRARTNAVQGAAVRDLDGRTYAGAAVSLPSLRVSALDVCIAMAVSSGAKGLEAAVVLVADPTAELDVAVVGDLGGAEVPVYVGDARGSIARIVMTETGSG